MSKTTEPEVADPVASSLLDAARRNNVLVCEQTYGHVPIRINARAFRIAAENKSYEAFEHMLNISAVHADGLGSVYSIPLGSDWDHVEQIAKTDRRIADALQRYDQQLDLNVQELSKHAQAIEKTLKSDPPEQGSRFKRAFLQAGRVWDYAKARIGAIVQRTPKI